MAKQDNNIEHQAVAADANAELLVRLQQELDAIQNRGISPMQLREALFQKMLDLYHVPMQHSLRAEPIPMNLDDPSIKTKLNQHGFYRHGRPILH
ncbi:hypothetical protein PULV_a0098 [Pseudoalteromonas ulvae UL12]|uniref:Uncharacterized protein n=1 Tax=Pseudoalteromonas ulvae TaxID=107327 RepID=A0A244CV89_PSEDV|nr:hypothetical protein [Pseudoalteromonas ulvae]MBE0362579.1 hypothetical protein [Pseudoalteromonas ulvae UL12]OUL59464.1 hypothetical protein B1199_04135 [Pseudoalteromonas ulvae]